MRKGWHERRDASQTDRAIPGIRDLILRGEFAVGERSTESDLDDAIEVRGTIEGLAARLAAERGVSRLVISDMRECLAEIDAARCSAAMRKGATAGGRRHSCLKNMLRMRQGGFYVRTIKQQQEERK